MCPFSRTPWRTGEDCTSSFEGNRVGVVKSAKDPACAERSDGAPKEERFEEPVTDADDDTPHRKMITTVVLSLCG